MKQRAGILAVCLLAAGSGSGSENFVERVADAMSGTWVSTDGRFVDRRIRVSAPRLGATVVYLQLNQGVVPEVYRQRILLLEYDPRSKTVRQSAYSFTDPAVFLDATAEHEGFAELDLNDLQAGFDEGCAQLWRQHGDTISGYVDPATCRIASKHAGQMRRIEAETHINGNTLRLAERGFDDSMEKQLFGTPPGGWLELTRREGARGP